VDAQIVTTININISGNGTVRSIPGGNLCTTNISPCPFQFLDDDLPVFLTATPISTIPATVFVGWGGSCASGGSAFQIMVNETGNLNCSASFELDVDECTNGSDNCDINATCTNVPGSFTCECNPGFTGDGTTDGTGCTQVTTAMCDYQTEAGQCSDNIDNDGDGAIDMQDGDCVSGLQINESSFNLCRIDGTDFVTASFTAFNATSCTIINGRLSLPGELQNRNFSNIGIFNDINRWFVNIDTRPLDPIDITNGDISYECTDGTDTEMAIFNFNIQSLPVCL